MSSFIYGWSDFNNDRRVFGLRHSIITGACIVNIINIQILNGSLSSIVFYIDVNMNTHSNSTNKALSF